GAHRDDRELSRRDGPVAHPARPRLGATAPTRADGHPLLAGRGRHAHDRDDRHAPPALGRRAATPGKAGPAAPPADVPAGAPRTYIYRRLPLADDVVPGPEGGG